MPGSFWWVLSTLMLMFSPLDLDASWKECPCPYFMPITAISRSKDSHYMLVLSHMMETQKTLTAGWGRTFCRDAVFSCITIYRFHTGRNRSDNIRGAWCHFKRIKKMQWGQHGGLRYSCSISMSFQVLKWLPLPPPMAVLSLGKAGGGTTRVTRTTVLLREACLNPFKMTGGPQSIFTTIPCSS